MVDTNALLSIAFTLISNFTNVVPLSPKAVPQKPEDLQGYVIGSPNSPVDAHLVGRYGTEFWIRRGAIHGYSSPGSYFGAQGGPIERFYGTSIINSNDAIQIAAKVVQRLAKRSNPLTNGLPSLRCPTSERIPFLQVSWPSPPGYLGSDLAAQVEIDGRDRSIVDVHVWTPAFEDFAFEDEMKRKAYTADPIKPRPPQKKIAYPKPATSDVAQAIQSWLVFCEKLGLEPGEQTNLANVDWEKTLIYTNLAVSTSAPVCLIRFQNGTLFETLYGVVFAHACRDACYTGAYLERPEAEWAKFQGRVTWKWQDSARDLEARIAQNMAIRKSVYEPSEPFPRMLGANLGQTGCVRALVYWHRLPRLPGSDAADEDFRSFLYAEFDLETGRPKLVVVNDRRLIEALGRALRKASR